MPDIFDQVATSPPPAGDIFDQIGKGQGAGQHAPVHPLKGQNFGDWLSEELLGPVVSAATQLGKGIQGLGHPEQRPLKESAQDVLSGGMGITAPFAMGGLGGREAPPPGAPAPPPSAMGTAARGAMRGAIKSVPNAIETSILRYTGLPQIARGAYNEAKAALAARAASAAPQAAAPAPTPAPVAAPAAETLADGTTVNDILVGQGVKNPAKATPEARAGAQTIFDRLKAQGQARPRAAEATPENPAPSAPAPTTAPAAAPPEPQPAPKSAAGDIAKAAQAADKGRRFADAVTKYRQAHPDQDWVQSTDFLEGWANDAVKSRLTRSLIKEGYLPNHETFSDTSWPYMIQRLRAAEAPQ